MEIIAAADGYATTTPTTIVKKDKHRKLSIEDYLDYIDDRTFDLTADQFRQILGMHGWTKSQAQKSAVVDMVVTLELMDLHRSTLLDAVVSGDTEITLNEAISDLKNLDWDECHVSSILTNRAVAPATAVEGRPVSAKGKTPVSARKKAAEEVDDSPVSGGTAAAAGGTTASAKRKTRLTFGKKKKAEVAVDDSPVSGGTTAAEGGTTASATRKARITFGKRKAADVAVTDSLVSAGTPAAAGSTTDSAKRRARITFGKKAVDNSAVSAGTTVAARGTTVLVERKSTPKTLGKIGSDDSTFSGGTAVAAGSTTFTLRRKRPKTSENEKAAEVAVDDSAVDAGTTAAAGSTTDGLGGTVPVKQNMSKSSGKKATEVGGVAFSAIPAILLLMRNVPPKRAKNEED